MWLGCCCCCQKAPKNSTSFAKLTADKQNTPQWTHGLFNTYLRTYSEYVPMTHVPKYHATSTTYNQKQRPKCPNKYPRHLQYLQVLLMYLWIFVLRYVAMTYEPKYHATGRYYYIYTYIYEPLRIWWQSQHCVVCAPPPLGSQWTRKCT